MKRLPSKRIVLLICLIMIISSFTGCSSSSNKSSASSDKTTEVSKDPNKMDWQLDTSPVTIQGYTDRSWFGDWNDPVAKRITQKTGVTLNVKIPAKDETNESINLMIASKQFPDVMFLAGNNDAVSALIKNNLVYSMDELINKYAPKLKTILDSEVGPEILKNYKASDGQNYALYYGLNTELVSKIKNDMSVLLPIWLPRFNIRSDYYQEIGKPDMTTPAGFMSALEQIKSKHPDKGGLIVQNISWFKNEFGLDSYYVSDGTLKLQIKDPKYLEMVKYCNQLYNKGLLAKDGFMNPPWDVLSKKWTNGENLGIMGNYADEGKPLGNTNTTILSLPPFKTYSYTMVPSPWMCAVIPKQSKIADRTIKFLEYCASKEGNVDMAYGVKGDAFGTLENGPQYSVRPDAKHQLFPDGKPVWFKEFNDQFQKDNNLVKNTTGIFKHNIMNNWAIFDWNIPEWANADPKMKAYQAEMGPHFKQKPEYAINIPGQSDEALIKEKASKLVNDYEVKMVFAKDEAGVTAAYNELLQKCEQIDIAKLEAEYTKQYKENMAKFGK